MDSLDSRILSDTEGVTGSQFWSHDSRFVVFTPRASSRRRISGAVRRKSFSKRRAVRAVLGTKTTFSSSRAVRVSFAFLLQTRRPGLLPSWIHPERNWIISRDEASTVRRRSHNLRLALGCGAGRPFPDEHRARGNRRLGHCNRQLAGRAQEVGRAVYGPSSLASSKNPGPSVGGSERYSVATPSQNLIQYSAHSPHSHVR